MIFWMKWDIESRITKGFKKEAKPLLKKYPSLGQDLRILQNELIENPQKGTSLGNNTFKIRLKISSKKKGKSGGARVITFTETELIGQLEEINEGKVIINLISIYDKSETSSLKDSEIRDLIRNIEY